MVAWNESLAEVQADRERQEVPLDWRAWESTVLSLRRRRMMRERRLYHVELAVVAFTVTACFILIAVATQARLG